MQAKATGDHEVLQLRRHLQELGDAHNHTLAVRQMPFLLNTGW
jgi:hypothetical protein